MVETSDTQESAPVPSDAPLDAGRPLESVALRIGKVTYVIGTLWLSWAKRQVGPREARA